MIENSKINIFLDSWIDGIIRIGKVYLQDGNYKKSAEKFSKDGKYYLTGDTGSIDENGYFYFSTRDDDVIIMAGYRIGPFEVESALSTHKVVAECAVIATPDKVRGEVIEAFVVLMPESSKSDQLTDELQKWVKTTKTLFLGINNFRFFHNQHKTSATSKRCHSDVIRGRH
mgnify:CR=1 FL=1